VIEVGRHLSTEFGGPVAAGIDVPRQQSTSDQNASRSRVTARRQLSAIGKEQQDGDLRLAQSELESHCMSLPFMN
jgi:hypothetical protein